MGNNVLGKKSEIPSYRRSYANTTGQMVYTTGRITQNFILIWLDENIKVSTEDYKYTMSQLRKVINSVATFTNVNSCIDFIMQLKGEYIFLIVSGKAGKEIIKNVHDCTELNIIYVFCAQPKYHQWTTNWNKIKCVSNQIEDICVQLAKDAVQWERYLTPTSILTLNVNAVHDFNQIDRSFMYSQLLKEILLDMEYDNQAINIFVEFAENQHRENEWEMNQIKDFRNRYKQHSLLGWYTQENFLYKMLNRSLRMFEIDTIATMGFIMKSIHTEIERLHQKQLNEIKKTDKNDPVKVYRGQGMSKEHFDKMCKNKGGLITFTSFLSTSRNCNIALKFAQNSCHYSSTIPVLFEISISQTDTSTVFADIKDVAFHPDEEEILFTMHSIFQIGQVSKYNENIWKVKLTSVDSKSPQLIELMNRIRCEIGGNDPIERLGRLMIYLEEFDKAESLYSCLLALNSTEDDLLLARTNTQFGYIVYASKKKSWEKEAQSYYQKALEIQERMRPTSDRDLISTYNNMGLLFTHTQRCLEAFQYYEKAIAIYNTLSDKNILEMATVYNNIGLLYDQNHNYTAAIARYKDALTIYEKLLSPNHFWIAKVYQNIGLAYTSMERSEEALNNLVKALEILKICFPSNHKSISKTMIMIGDVYNQSRDYSSAISFYQQALDREEATSEPNYSFIAWTYYDISMVHDKLDNSNLAIDSILKAIEQARKAQPVDETQIKKFNNYLHKLLPDS